MACALLTSRLSSSTCLLVASTVDHWVRTSLILLLTSWTCTHKSFSAGLDIASVFLCLMLGTLLPMATHDDARFTIIDQCWFHHFQTGTATLSGHRSPPPCRQNLQKHLSATYLPHHCIMHTTLLVHSADHSSDHSSVSKLFLLVTYSL